MWLLAAAAGSQCTFDSSGLLYDGSVAVDAPSIDAAPVDAVVDAAPIDAVAPQTSLAIDDVRLVFGEVASARIQSFRWSAADGSWTMEQPTSDLGGSVRWTVNAVSPDGRGVELLGALTQDLDNLTLHLLRWEHGEDQWVTDWKFSSPLLDGDKRGFDVAFESLSGDVLVVYADGGHTPTYRTYTSGAWSEPFSLPLNDGDGEYPDPNTGTVLWVELAPRPGSDEIALAYADAENDLVALIWDGDQWVGESTRALTTELKHNPLTNQVSNRAFDLAYTTISSDLMVAWGTSGTSDFTYAVRRPVTGQWYPESEHVASVINGEAHFVDLSPDPGSNRIAGGFYDLGDGTERLGLGIWTGTEWTNTGELDSQMLDVNDTGTGDFPGAVDWISPGHVALATYPDNQLGSLDWARWSELSPWQIGNDITFATKGFTESMQIAASGDHGRLLVVCSDNNLRLFAATYDGTNWQLSNLGAPLTTSVASVTTVPFSLASRVR